MTTTSVHAATSIPAREELVSRAADLIPLLRSNIHQASRERRVPRANLEAIRDAELFKLTLPRRWVCCTDR